MRWALRSVGDKAKSAAQSDPGGPTGATLDSPGAAYGVGSCTSCAPAGVAKCPFREFRRNARPGRKAYVRRTARDPASRRKIPIAGGHTVLRLPNDAWHADRALTSLQVVITVDCHVTGTFSVQDRGTERDEGVGRVMVGCPTARRIRAAAIANVLRHIECDVCVPACLHAPLDRLVRVSTCTVGGPSDAASHLGRPR